MIDMKVSVPVQGTMLCGDEKKYAYPEGLKIKLENDELQRLGINPDALPPLGTAMMVKAAARVQEVSKEQLADGTFEVCVSLQIEQMELGVEGPSIAERMYSKG